ncbi:tol-pal system YbgF family protein [Streptomyces sp. NPDC018610]|uniref:tol-pal system YbgF family protein n=1 Tax=Streptomyces sp. NPDC018610 TaxID=3365049 RepID=UPI00379F552F
MPRRRGRNALLAELLAEANISAAELARDVNRLAAAEGVSLRYDRTTVAHWLTGSRPRGLVPQLVAEALTRRTGRPVSAQETGLTDVADKTAEGEQGNVLQDLVVLARTDVDPARRVTLLQSVFRQRSVPSAEAVHAEQSVGPVRHRAAVTGADVERVRFMVSQFAAGWYRYGGGHARTALASCLGDDVGRLLVRPATPPVRTELMSATAQLAHLMGEMVADAGHQGLAQRYYLLALDTATEAGDHHTRAIILRGMSVQAARMNVLRYAADLADAAVTAAASDSGDLRAFVLVQRAYVRSLRGEHESAYRDLGMAEQSLDRAVDCRNAFFHYPRAGFAYRQGQTLYRLRDVGPALDALRYAAAERSAHDHRLRALSQARAALVLLAQGRADEACVHGRLFVEEYPFLRSRRSVLALRELRARLMPFRRVPEAASLLARLSSLTPPTEPAWRYPGA